MSNIAPVIEDTTYAPSAELYLISALVKSEDILEHLSKTIEQHKATVDKSESLGQKQLFHLINKQNSLFLVSVYFTAIPSIIPGLEADLQRDETIERFIVTTWRADINQPIRNPRGRSDRPYKEREQD